MANLAVKYVTIIQRQYVDSIIDGKPIFGEIIAASMREHATLDAALDYIYIECSDIAVRPPMRSVQMSALDKCTLAYDYETVDGCIWRNVVKIKHVIEEFVELSYSPIRMAEELGEVE